MERADVGCDRVQVRCDSTHVNYLVSFFANNSEGSDHYYPEGSECLRQRCVHSLPQQEEELQEDQEDEEEEEEDETEEEQEDQEEWQLPSESLLAAPHGVARQAVAAGGLLFLGVAFLAVRLWKTRPRSDVEDGEEDALLFIE